jgi:hypothetical protein
MLLFVSRIVDRRAARHLAALVFVLSGCGGGGDRLTHDQYERRLDGSLTRLDARIVALGANAKALTRLRDALRTTADELDALAPPADAEGANDDLVDGLREFAASVGAESQTIAHARGVEAREALSRLARSQGVKDIQHAEGDLRRAGYRLP